MARTPRLTRTLICLCLLVLSPSQAAAVLPWGALIGGYQSCPEAPAVAAFSNGHWEWYPSRLSGHGKKWQCVEYVNRFYAEVYGLKIEGGDAKHYFRRAAAKGLLAFPNGQAAPPEPGDILCSEGGPWGHVAIVRSVGEGEVHIIQQNWFNDERDLDMILPLTLKDGLYRVGGFAPSHPVCGWLRAPCPEDRQVVPASVSPTPSQPLAASS
jgi:surface antigen